MIASAVVSIAALDVRRRPGHRSELRSQLLMGEVVDLLAVAGRGRWSRVRNRSDGYRGWVRTWGLLPLPASEIERWAAAADWRVSTRHLELRGAPGRGAILGPLFWNSAVPRMRLEKGFALVRLPDGTEGWTERGNLRRRTRPAGGLREVVSDFQGIPYLWGGRTPMGFDCSGFVQQTLAGTGVDVPRDAHQQFLACRPIRSMRGVLPGDLFFFGSGGGRMTHVGIALGKNLYAHARGIVRINSLDPRNPLHDSELSDTLRAIGRP
jgi:gamma-D-glutamyl-L-lysine dipeptidyl-peptidase